MATRFDRLAVRYEATEHIAAINEWLWPTSTQAQAGTNATRPRPSSSGVVSGTAAAQPRVTLAASSAPRVVACPSVLLHRPRGRRGARPP
ncbi:hypothetical protein F8274_01005 [Micromonospora sp. AMSO31t]|nr:hypothetical protein F8274_01005 [Micromonospora sp. AMSO31t]